MENNDFVIERILSVEDFENVDEDLMKLIDGNDEYRRIFEEYREISRLTKECVPEPEKDGVSLCKAVMDRVSKGDVAPRYLNVKGFRFPFTAAACIIVVFAALVVMRNGNFGRKFDNGANESSFDAEYKADTAEDGISDMQFGVMRTSECPETEFGYVENEEVCDGDAANGSGGGFAMYSYSAETDDVTDDAAYEESADCKNGFFSAAPSDDGNAALEIAEEVISDGTEDKFLRKEDASADGVSGVQSVIAEDELRDSSLCEAVLECMRYAEKCGVPTERLFGADVILVYGEDLYIEWFDSIKDKDNFYELYCIEEFSAYCE